ncbi:hypothetical protein [Streptomyces clavifer]|uniref:hypothetical protein n=1 Tax=Streptomyces clavifer TaxID=68188 RepID=UPI00364DE4EB
MGRIRRPGAGRKRVVDRNPAGRCARDCLLGHAVAGARTDALLPGGVLGLVAAGLAARSGDEMPATVTGVHLPAQHRHTGTFTAAHPELYALTPGRTTRPPDGCAGAGTARCC